MPSNQVPVPIYLEIGKKKVFAAAAAWPGWCRIGRDEAGAQEALFKAGPRYASVLAKAGLDFRAPADPSALQVAERVEGNTTTDFGAPDALITGDKDPIDSSELDRMTAILESCWAVFELAVESGVGKQLRKGPRGGGRDLPGIVDHVVGAEVSYLKRLGWKVEDRKQDGREKRFARLRTGVLEGLTEAAAGNLPSEGPRGGRRWPARFYLRRSAWHLLDHAWEIEDRTL